MGGACAMLWSSAERFIRKPMEEDGWCFLPPQGKGNAQCLKTEYSSGDLRYERYSPCVWGVLFDPAQCTSSPNSSTAVATELTGVASDSSVCSTYTGPPQSGQADCHTWLASHRG